MQKLADGHDTDVGSSIPRPWSRFVAAPRAGAALDCAALADTVAGCPPAVEPPVDPGAGADPLHPVAAPISRMDTQANASRSRPVMCGFQRPITASVYSADSRVFFFVIMEAAQRPALPENRLSTLKL